MTALRSPTFPTHCRSCNAPIRWETTLRGKWVPISIATGLTHFRDCPQASTWSRPPMPKLP